MSRLRASASAARAQAKRLFRGKVLNQEREQALIDLAERLVVDRSQGANPSIGGQAWIMRRTHEAFVEGPVELAADLITGRQRRHLSQRGNQPAGQVRILVISQNTQQRLHPKRIGELSAGIPHGFEQQHPCLGGNSGSGQLLDDPGRQTRCPCQPSQPRLERTALLGAGLFVGQILPQSIREQAAQFLRMARHDPPGDILHPGVRRIEFGHYLLRVELSARHLIERDHRPPPDASVRAFQTDPRGFAIGNLDERVNQ